MLNFNSLAIFCGSNPGTDPAFAEQAIALADRMTEKEIDLVYGAGSVGLMGIIADRMLENGRKVTGVIPQHLMDLEVGHTGITDLRVVKDMHERKMMMADLSDGFIAMPGGIGTLEEIIEVFTWNQLGIHAKPCAFLNVNGYYDKLFEFLKHAVNVKLLKREHLDSLLVAEDPATLLAKMENSDGKYAAKWY
ncbi:TIGR00730 family Rossman fold protein [Lewinellaceae bacterium SD302]|nr:TIGR00730 family Rossman fold protein [Lewinellaceae bacterium SD302]